MKRLLAIWLIFVTISASAIPRTIETAGDIGQIAIPVVAGLSTIFLRDQTGFWQFTKSYLVTLGTVYILKPLVNRRRPNGGRYSFPSGHTASAFAGAAFIQRRYGWGYGVPAYAAASFVGVSRVVTKWHWTTDVLAGAAIGILANYIFTSRYQMVKVAPYVAPHAAGVTVTVPLPQDRFASANRILP